jgi:hypothetical protein
MKNTNFKEGVDKIFSFNRYYPYYTYLTHHIYTNLTIKPNFLILKYLLNPLLKQCEEALHGHSTQSRRLGAPVLQRYVSQ